MENILNDVMFQNDNIKIYSMCFLTYPCKHSVQYKEKEKETWSAIQIYNYFKSNNLGILKHFEYCDKC